MRSFWYFFSGMFRAQRGRVIAALLCAFFAAGGLGVALLSLGPALGLMLSPEGEGSLVAIASQHNASGHWFQVPEAVLSQLPETPWAGAVFIMGLMMIVTVFGTTCSFAHRYLSAKVTIQMVSELRATLFHHAIGLSLTSAINRGSSSIATLILQDTARLKSGLLMLIDKWVSQFSRGVAAFLAAIWFDWRMAAVGLILAPTLVYVLRRIGKRIRRGTTGLLEASQEVLGTTSESLRGLRAVKANTAEDMVHGRFARSNAHLKRSEWRIQLAFAVSSPLVELIAVTSILFICLFAAKSILSGGLGAEDFILSLSALGVAGGSFRPLANMINTIQSAGIPAKRLRQLLDEDIEPAGEGVQSLPRHAESIVFESVSFTYPGRNVPAVADASLSIAHGEMIAIVGANGSGKTTLAALIPRLLVPSSGRVLVDGIDINEVALPSLRSQIALVTQDVVMFSDTVAANIAFGLQGMTDQDMEDAARRARAHEFIIALPEGYETVCAEGGSSLSGGQRQRLALARAMMRDPSILILDEATSQIDSESEEKISEALDEYCRDRTTIIIAHRLRSVRSADRIFVLEDGHIRDMGSHDELIRTSLLYRRLVETQLVASGE